jgi:broad specificity phosphatase PhoE
MRFRLHIVRHAEGTHNPAHDTTIPDPPLTQRGIEQSQELSQTFQFKESVGLVLASPLRRTLQTAHIGFQQTLDQRYYAKGSGAGVQKGAQLVLEPDVQAHSSRPCDTGSNISILQSEYQDLPWDILELDPIFPNKEGLYASDSETLKQRGWRIQRRLEEKFKELANTSRPDIVVVTHGGIIRFVTGDDTMSIGPAKARSFMVTFDQDSRLVIEHSLSG